MRFGKLLISTSALLFASFVRAAAVPEETALSVAGGFLRQSSVASRLLPGRTVLSAQFRGNLWIVALEPSGHIIIAGSDKCAPVVSFATDDFAEPEAGSALYAQLQNTGDWVAGKEADESAAVDSGWAEYTAAVSRKRLLLAAPSSATVGDGYDDFVNPFLGTTWSQGAPMTDLTPLTSPCGCAATAGGQEFRHWRWPYRFEKSRSFTHALRDSYNNALNYTMRPDGRVPIDWDKVAAAGTSSTPWETDKTVGYNTAFLTMWMQTMVNMGFKAGGSYATRKLCSDAENYWYEAGKVMSQGRDGYDNLWCAITNDLKFGSPIQINTPVHQMVIDGFAIENSGTANEVDYVNTNYGWGNGIRWENLKTAIESGGGAGKFADFQIGFRPQKIVQFEPVAKISTSDLTLVWHIAPCWTNRTTGFIVQIAKAGGVTTTESVATHEETTTWMKTGLDDGGEYTFTVTPVMADGSEARANSVTTTIGTPAAAPEIVSVSSVACGIDLVQQGFFIECARAITNYIAVTCSESTTGLEAYSSHLTILPDEKLSVSKSGTVFTIAVDATDMPATWNGEMLLLTLVAKNSDGTEAYKNLMLRFNGMRQVLSGSFEMVETNPTTPVWFCGTTTLDAKGQAITFGANAFQGNGCDVTLTDSVGGGSFSFESLDGFLGTLHITSAATVNLPSDMSRFCGTLAYDRCYTDNTFHYTLSRDLPATATVYLPQYTMLYLDNVTVDAAFTGNGAVYITSGTSTLSNTSGFSGTVELGDYTNAGTLTLNAGEEPGISIWNGTLYLTLSREQVAYGYSTSQIKYNWGTVVFQDEDGNELKRWTTDDKTFAVNASANTWTPDVGTGTGRFNDTSRWSRGVIPGEGDLVIFNDNFGDTEMTLDLSSDFSLAHVKVIGTRFTIKSSGTGNLTVDTLENTIPTKLATTKIVPTTVIPRGKLFVQTGLTISCDIDSSLAKNLRDISDAMSALIWDDGDDYCIWRGTVVFKDYTAAYLDLTEWGHARSSVRFNGVTGHITSNKTYDVPVEFVDNGSTVALNWNNGSSGATDTFAKIFGSGTFKTTAGGGNNENILVKDSSEFTGSFQLAAKNVIFGSAVPSNDIGTGGRLHILTDATLTPSAIWNIGGGVYLGSGCNLTVRGQLLSTGTTASIKACADDTQIIFEDGSLLRTAVALSGDYSPDISFKAATWQATQNRTETKTVNFCSSSGSYTTLDANGNKVTLGENFFSGSGDVYLTSSTDGGSFVIQGLSSAFTGTIYTDITAGLTMDDMSASTGCISISDAGLAISSAKLGNIIVGTGATLTVSLTDSEAMKGFSASTVTLDGGTIEFVDQYGTTVGSSTESTTYVKPDGYTLAPVPTAVWVSGEFEDEAALHGGYKIAPNGNTVNDRGNIVIGSATTLGATIDIAAVTNCTKVTILAKIKTPTGGAPAANSVVAGVLATDNHPIGAACKTAGETNIQGYWLNGANANYNNDGYKFGGSMQALSEGESYMLFAFQSDPSSISPTTGTALYFGESFGEMSGGNVSGLQWRGYTNSCVSVGGPANSVASMNTVPWSGLEIEAVALFADSWLAPGDVALYEFPEAKAVVPSWAVASVTLQDGNVKYYRDITVAFYEILNGDVDADTVQVLDDSSVDYSGLGFEYDAATQSYSKIKTVIAKIDNGIILLEYTTLAAACEEADLQGIGVVELLAARDSISEAIPSGWSYVSPEDSGTEYGTILKTISEIPGTVSSIAITQENVLASADGEWAEVSTKPIYITLGSATNAFTLSFDADIPDGVCGTLLSWDSVLGTTTLDSRVVITNDAAKQVIWRKTDGTLSTVEYTTSELIQSGEHYIELNWVHNSGATIKVDGEKYYDSGSLKFTDYLTSRLAFGGSALGSPDDVLAGLKVKNLNFRVGKQPTEPDEENENFPRLGYVTRLDGTVYHGNDVNRAVITNWQTQITGVAKRPVPEGKADADFKTIDLLFVYDTPGKAYVESNESTWNGASALEVYSAKATAKMNQILCTTDMDTNFWFRMVGVHTVDGTGGTLNEILGKCEGLTGEYKHMLELRDRYGADVIVCPSPNGGGIGGLARLNTLDEIKRRGQNAAYHFATVLLNYSQTHAWVHEIGHNMSLNHYPPANFDPANTWRGLGFQHKIAVDGTPMSSVMAEQGYADFCGGFSSKNHIYHGSRLSISNHLDSTGVLLEAAPYVSEWRTTRIPETRSIKCLPDNGSTLVGDTEFTLSYPDPDAEIYYQAWGLNDNEFVKYNGPFTIPATTGYAYITAYAVTNGVATAQELVNYSTFGDTYKDVFGSGSLPWSIVSSIDGNWAPSNGGYYEINDNFTGKSNSVCVLSTSLNGPDTLTFEHSELLKDNPYWHDAYPHSYPNSSFVVWVDNEPAYALRDATNTIGSWVSTDIAIPEGTHKVEFVYTHRSGYVSGETVRIKSVALASAQEPEDPPVDEDEYAVEPAAVWCGDFKTAEKNGYTLSTSGTTAIADDTYGSTITIGDSAATIAIPEPTRQWTMLVKYSAAPAQTAQNFFAGGSFTNGASKVDIGLLSTSSSSSALTAGYDNGSAVTAKALGETITPSTTGGYILIAHDAGGNLSVYAGDTFKTLTTTSATIDYKFTNWYYTSLAVGGPSGVLVSNKCGAWDGLVLEKVAIFDGYYTPGDLIVLENPEDAATLEIAAGATWNFAAGTTRTYENIGTLSASGTIAVTNDTVGVGVYKLAEWTTAQKKSTGYGYVGTLSTPGLVPGLTAELVYGAKAIYLRVYDATAQAAKGTLKIWPYGDSITEGFNASDTKANYRVLLGQKLAMLGFNVEMVGCYDKIQTKTASDLEFMDAIDPSGATIPDAWKWHSAKHGGTVGVTAATSYQRSAMLENVDTLCAQVGNPDVVLVHGGINDLYASGETAASVFGYVTNLVNKLVADLPNTKVIVSTLLYGDAAIQDRKNYNSSHVEPFNNSLKELMQPANLPAAWDGRVFLADLNDCVSTYRDDAAPAWITVDNLHPDWWGHDEMAEGWLSVITNEFTASQTFPSATPLTAVANEDLGAAAKTELADYIDGFTLAQTITVASTNEPAIVNGEGVTENIGKVGYFVEYVRADNEAHKWVWVDMDAFGTTIADLGLPTANHQTAVTCLHVKSNHNGIEDVAADDDSVSGWIEFSPFDYTGNSSGVTGAPTAHGGNGYSMFDWNDTLGSSGTMGSMQVFRLAPPSGRPAQALFAYNNWQSDSTAAEFGVGNFAQHFWGGAQTLDYTYTKGLEKMNASAYRVKRIEIWTKEAPSNNGKATVVRVHPRLTRGLAREALLGIRFDNALGGNASAFDVKFVLVNCTKADITDIKYWRQPYTHNYGFYEAEATEGPSATVSAADGAMEFTASFPAGSVWFYPQVGTREDSDYLWVTATINPEISPDAQIWVSVPTEKITLSNGGVFDVVNGAETQPHRVFPFVHQIGAYLRQDDTALTGTWAGKLEDSPANRVGNLTDIVVCNDFLVAYDSENDTFTTTWDARGGDNTAQVARIKALRDQYNPKCMIRASLTKGEETITVDGVTGRPIACAAASAARRKQLIDSILAVMESAGLDGLDIDWEYPGDHDVTTANTQRDWHAYGLLMRDLAAAFFDKGYVLSFCSNLGYQMAPEGYYAAFHAADFVNAMAYGNTTLNASPQVMMTGINVCTSRGVPPRRIVVGQAMYAYEVQNPGWDSVVGWLKVAWPDDNTRWWDADLVWTNRTATKADNTVLSTEKETFEGPSSYHAKCNWCRANGYGGVMSWGYYTDFTWDDADLMSLARHQAKSCWPRENWSWPTPPQDNDGAYLLDSEEDWFWLRDNPSVNARFAADIALVHDPLPIETFSGTIDGAGHTLTISNDVWLAYDTNPALIRTLTGTVKNLTIDLYGRVVSRASRWNDTTASKTANTLATNVTHNAAVLAANLGAGGVIDGVELFIRPGAEVQGPQRVAGLAASVWVGNGNHAEIRNSSVHVDGVVRSLARNTAEGNITVQNQCAGGLAGWVGCPGAQNIVVTNNIVSLASTGRVAVETGSSSSAGGVIGDLNNVNPLVQSNAVYVASGATVSANESAAAGKVRTSYANASYSIASSGNAGQTLFFIEDGAAALADSVGGTGEATVSVVDYGTATDGLSVDAVAGFWYSVIYGDELGAGGIGGKTGETAPVKAAVSGQLKLDAPKDGAKRFYRVKVAPVAE